MARTLVTGNILRSGSIPTTALGGGVVTSSLQIVASLPTGSLSSSAQVNYPDISNIPGGIASSSAQIKDYLPVDTVSSSVQVTAFLPTGTVSSSTQLPSGIASSSAQVTAYLPTGTVSSSGQVDVFSTIGGGALATTGSNTFTVPQTISDTTNSTSYLDGALHVAGGMSVRKDVRISGSMTINGLLTAVSMSTQYVTSSEYVVGTSRITLNDDDNVRFAGLSIIDSGSASPTSASIFWDSLNHHFIYENLSGSAYNSAIIIAGPKNTGSLGDEATLTTGYIPVATGTDHIDNSVMFQSGSNVGIGTTNPSFKLHVDGGTSAATLLVEDDTRAHLQLKTTDAGQQYAFIRFIGATNNFEMGQRNDTGVFYLNPTINAGETGAAIVITESGNVGIGTISPTARLEVSGSNTQGLLHLKSPNAQSALFVSGSGNVGVGVTTPTYKLQVAGDIVNSTNLLDSGDPGILLGDGHRLGFNQAGVRSWNIKPTGGNLQISSGDSLGYYIFTGDRVGISTTPGHKFHVVGSSMAFDTADSVRILINRTNTSNLGSIIWTTGGASTANGFAEIGMMSSDGTDGLHFKVNPTAAAYTTRMYISASGNIGIGTTTPSYKLDVNGLAAADRFVLRSSTTSGFEGALTAIADNTVYNILAGPANGPTIRARWSGGTTNRYLEFGQTDNNSIYTPRVTIIDGGSVGVGVTNPDAKLHVALANTGTIGGQIVIDNPATSALGNTAEISFLTDAGASGTGTRNARILAINENVNNGAARMELHTWDGGTSAARLTIKSGGSVGIGTTNPSQQLHITGYARMLGYQLWETGGTISGFVGYEKAWTGAGSSNDFAIAAESGNNIKFYTNGSATLRMVLNTSGNLGIGTPSPTDKLTIQGTSLKFYTTQNVADQYTYIGTEYDNGNGNNKAEIRFAIDGADTQTRIQFHTANTAGNIGERMRIRYNGNVGIGTTTPIAKLHVTGNTNLHGGIIRTWTLGQCSATAGVTTTATSMYTIKVKRSENYYKGLMWDVYMAGGKDWSGHGYNTYYGKMLMTFLSTDTVRVHLITEFGRGYLDNSQTELYYDSATSSTDTNYLYVTMKYKGANATEGFRPNMFIISYDANNNGNDVTLIEDIYSA